MAARVITLDDQGEVRLREDAANGSDYVGHKAAASVTSTYSVEWPGAPPGSELFMKMDASGVVSFAAGASGTIDEAYDSGGAGAGRIITADAGPVEAAGAGGFLASHSAPVYGLETTGVERNYRLTAGQTAGILEIQVGDADGDISDDTFDALFSLDGANGRLGIGTATPLTLAHFIALAGTDATLVLQAPGTRDASVAFAEGGVTRFTFGYDDSAGGLVVGRLSFANPAVFVEDTTADIGIGTVTPGAKLDVLQAANESALLINKTGAGAGTVLDLENDGTGIGLLIDQDGNGIALDIDSEATGNPLIRLVPAANTRGTISITGAATDPSGPVVGDIWYNSAEGHLRYLDQSARILNLGSHTYSTVADPGDAGTITPPATSNFRCEFTNSTGAQTRVFGSPAFVGQRAILIALFSGGGTSTTIAEPSGTGWLGGGTADDTATFDTSGELIEAVAVSLTEWRASSSFGVAFS